MSTKKTEDDNLRVTRDITDITDITDTTTAVAVGLLGFLIFLALLYLVNIFMAIVGLIVSGPLGEKFRSLYIANWIGVFVAPVGTICGSMAVRRSKLLKIGSVMQRP